MHCLACLITVTGFIHQYRDVCVPISTCNSLTSSFFINGIVTTWPESSSPYNITYDHTSEVYNFCFSNVSGNIVLIEFCHGFPDSTQCPLCSTLSGIFKFVSRADIIIHEESLISMPHTMPENCMKYTICCLQL